MLDRVTRLSLFIYKRSTKSTEKKLEQKLQCRLEHGEETINMSEEGDEISLTTSFLAQELLNELFVRALAGAEPVLAGAEMVNRCAELSWPVRS